MIEKHQCHRKRITQFLSHRTNVEELLVVLNHTLLFIVQVFNKRSCFKMKTKLTDQIVLGLEAPLGLQQRYRFHSIVTVIELHVLTWQIKTISIWEDWALWPNWGSVSANNNGASTQISKRGSVTQLVNNSIQLLEWTCLDNVGEYWMTNTNVN